MNSRERILAALRREQPDRVPVAEFLIDPKVAQAAIPEARDMADCMDKLGMDNICCGVVFSEVDRHDDGTWIDEWGVTYKYGSEVLSHPICGPISSMDDLRNYDPPDPDAPGRLQAQVRPAGSL